MTNTMQNRMGPGLVWQGSRKEEGKKRDSHACEQDALGKRKGD
jgi:hypothetical protein